MTRKTREWQNAIPLVQPVKKYSSNTFHNFILLYYNRREIRDRIFYASLALYRLLRVFSRTVRHLEQIPLLSYSSNNLTIVY